MVRVLLHRFARRGDVLLDPFAGTGTTLRVASQYGLTGLGFEPDPELYDVCQRECPPGTLIINDIAQRLCDYAIPECDLILTSPPFSPSGLQDGDGRDYFETIHTVFTLAKGRLRKDAMVLVEGVNVRSEEGVADPLAFNLNVVLSTIFTFQGEIVFCDTSPTANLFGFQHSHMLIYKN
ncbi:site-specific DNA-methyltransferase [Paraburkholderia aspalathi]|nr:site-specific DNA-methyltransferase [Paraburkholderia aspalathi]